MPIKSKTKTKVSRKTGNTLTKKKLIDAVKIGGTILGATGLSLLALKSAQEIKRHSVIADVAPECKLSPDNVKLKGPIPKIIHQIWIGDESRRPNNIMNTWRDFCSKHGWKYMLWGNKEAAALNMINRKCFDMSKSWIQKADILRYDIMNIYGGLYIDADMYWLGHNLEKYINFNTPFVGVYEPYNCNSFKLIEEPYIANGFFACIPKHPIVQRCIKKIPARLKQDRRIFIQTGPALLNSSIEGPITVIPSKWVFPVNFKTYKTTDNIDQYKETALVFTKSGFEIAGGIKAKINKLLE
jgi:mannosyltransferase OCH1-like enzyme